MKEEQMEEGVRSIARSQAQQVFEPEPETKVKQKIDKKKLIVYSAIMKPKFDDFSAD